MISVSVEKGVEIGSGRIDKSSSASLDPNWTNCLLFSRVNSLYDHEVSDVLEFE
jgi:hypothetical protein